MTCRSTTGGRLRGIAAGNTRVVAETMARGCEGTQKPSRGDIDLVFVAVQTGTGSGRHDQAIKGTWWMPWRQEAMKDVETCDKPRGAGKQASIRGFLNGETRPVRVIIN